ncbi:hypothetical protein BH11BAC1_BH11BAC1_30340 [soil metagenome]
MINGTQPNSLLQILNPIGEILYSEEISGKVEQLINPHLPPGFYFVQVSNYKRVMSGKLVIE